MKLEITSDFKEVCRRIVAANRTPEGWAEVESDDMYQVGNLTGGYDAVEGAFCFEIVEAGKEYWFQFSLAEATAVADGGNVSLELRPADR